METSAAMGHGPTYLAPGAQIFKVKSEGIVFPLNCLQGPKDQLSHDLDVFHFSGV